MTSSTTEQVTHLPEYIPFNDGNGVCPWCAADFRFPPDEADVHTVTCGSCNRVFVWHENVIRGDSKEYAILQFESPDQAAYSSEDPIVTVRARCPIDDQYQLRHAAVAMTDMVARIWQSPAVSSVVGYTIDVFAGDACAVLEIAVILAADVAEIDDIDPTVAPRHLFEIGVGRIEPDQPIPRP